ncbi:MAG: phosphoglycerate kinase, partial [Patescibacteria group bacterium]|nr:phosphoglycerate kinase [Patescibacteria group bacterium]
MAKIILLRLNFDIKEKPLAKSLRFNAAVSEIKRVSKANNKVVILSHRGRPDGFEKSLSLKPFVPLLTKALHKKIMFLDNQDLNLAEAAVKAAPEGSVFLLENVRFLRGEMENSAVLARQFSKLGTEFLNDDFATSHRADASLAAITKFLPSKPGNLLQEEVKNLSLALENPKSPFVLLIGGAKAKDKVDVIDNLIRKADLVLVGGAAANTFLKARGVDIKDSLYEPEMTEVAKKLLKNKKLAIPTDFVWENDKILDIGPRTAKLYSFYLKSAKMVVWNGPMGMFEKAKYAAGTKAAAKAVLGNKKAKIIIGGGETVAALGLKNQVQKPRPNVFLSTGGGAMLEFLAGEKMAGGSI